MFSLFVHLVMHDWIASCNDWLTILLVHKGCPQTLLMYHHFSVEVLWGWLTSVWRWSRHSHCQKSEWQTHWRCFCAIRDWRGWQSSFEKAQRNTGSTIRGALPKLTKWSSASVELVHQLCPQHAPPDVPPCCACPTSPLPPPPVSAWFTWTR